MDYEIQVKVKNAKLLNLMRERGIETAADLSRLSGVSQSDIGLMLNLKIGSIFLQDRVTYKTSVTTLANALFVAESDLFPDGDKYEPLTINTGSVQVSKEDMAALISNNSNVEQNLISSEFSVIDAIDIAGLTNRENKVMKMIYADEMKTTDIANEYKCSNNLILQIRNKSLRKIRDRIEGEHVIVDVLDSWE